MIITWNLRALSYDESLSSLQLTKVEGPQQSSEQSLHEIHLFDDLTQFHI